MANTRALPLAPKMQRDWIAALHEQGPILQRALECYLEMSHQDHSVGEITKITKAMEVLYAFDVMMRRLPKGGL